MQWESFHHLLFAHLSGTFVLDRHGCVCLPELQSRQDPGSSRVAVPALAVLKDIRGLLGSPRVAHPGVLIFVALQRELAGELEPAAS